MRTGGPRAAQEVHVVVLAVHTGVLLGAVADAEIHALMASFGNADARVHVGPLLLRVHGLDVDELEQFHLVQPPLRLLHDAAPIEIARLEGELPLDDPVADAAVAGDLDAAEMRQWPGLGREDHPCGAAVGAVVLIRGDARIRVTVVAQFVHRQFVRGGHRLPIARLPDDQRVLFLQLLKMIGGHGVEAAELDRRHSDRLPFVDSDRDIDRVLPTVQPDVDVGDARVGEAAVGVEGLDALQVGIKAAAVEGVLLRPGQLPADDGHHRVLARGQCALQQGDVHMRRSRELERMHGHGSALLAGGGGYRDEHDERQETSAAHVAPVHHSPCQSQFNGGRWRDGRRAPGGTRPRRGCAWPAQVLPAFPRSSVGMFQLSPRRRRTRCRAAMSGTTVVSVNGRDRLNQ